MKTRLLILLASLFLLIGVLFPFQTAQAQSLKPLNTNCTSGCYSWGAWDGTTYGGYAAMEFAGSGIGFFNSTAYMQRWLGLWGQQQGADGKGAIHAGEEVDSPYSGVCNGTSNLKTAYFFVMAWNSSNAQINVACHVMDAADANQANTIQVNPYVSNGGGMLVQIKGYSYPSDPNDKLVDYISYAQGMLHSFASMGLQEEIFDYVGGHEVWGAYNYGWEYVHSDGSFALQKRA